MKTIQDYINAVNNLMEAKEKMCPCCDVVESKCTCKPDCPDCDCGGNAKETKESVNEAASMNISMSGDNAGEVAELMKLMQNAGMPDAGPVMGMPHDHDSDCGCGSCAGDDHAEPDGDEGPIVALPMPKQGPDMAKMRDMVASSMDDKAEEDYANEPDEEYANVDYMTKDLSGGLNKQKKMYAKAQDGDNAMAVEELDKLSSSLKQAYEDFKSQYNEGKKSKGKKPDFLDVDKDGDKEEPMTKALKDKESK